jgi:hypothetical protein
MPVVASYAQASKKLAAAYDASGARMGPRFRLEHASDTAALRIQTVNGSFVVEQRLRAEVQCGVTPPDAPSKGGTCYARVDVLAAPLGKLDALVRFADANALPHWTTNPTWFKASIAQLKDRLEREGAQRLAEGREQSQAFSQMMYGAFQQNMARSASEHAAFMRQQESSFRSSMNAANAAMNARSTAASDWVDYALDQQTVTGTGGTTKISSAYSQTWSNGHGGWYQTNDTTNPNGILQGNWTKATVVHGNGQP